jgi:hypothetical protein
MTDPIRIAFGSLSAPIYEQLEAQGFNIDMDPLEGGYLQHAADEVARLLANHILTKSEAVNARQRILRMIKEQAKPL